MGNYRTYTKKKNRPIKLSLRQIINALLWINRTGSQWRNMESRYPKWQSIYYYFKKWRDEGLLEEVMVCLSMKNRESEGREASPSLLAIDSQSLTLAARTNHCRGIDGNKKINGRKRHILVDTNGDLFSVYVGSASQHDGEAGLELLVPLENFNSRLKVIRADKAYGGVFKKFATYYDIDVQISQSPPSKDRGFVPKAHRWQVERSFAWMNHYRRLSKDYERLPQSHEAFIQLAFINMKLVKS